MSEELSGYEKASRLKAIMGDAVFNEAVSNVREGIRRQWEQSADAVQRDILWHRQAALSDLMDALHAMEDDIKFNNWKFEKIVSNG